MWNYLSKTNKKIVLYGMGNGADKIINTLSSYGVKPYGVFASDDFVRGQNFRGYTVKKYSDFVEELKQFIVLVCFGTQRDDVLENITIIANEQELYAPDVPVYGDGLFTKDYVKDNQAKLQTVYNMLADDLSKQVFENTIEYRITGKIDYLHKIQTTQQEAFDNILHLSNDEIYCDLGAYTGDTVAEFLNEVDKYKKIIAVEPDIKNFKKLEKNTENLKDIAIINKGISEKNQILLFEMNGGRNSNLSSKGKEIQTTSVDNILGGNEVTYIKMDVEGFEKQAIIGAEKTIKNYKPKMLISAYHRNEDYFDLPLQVANIRNDYKVYMRHYKYIPAWDTQFYFI